MTPSRDGTDVDVLVDLVVDGEWCPVTRVGRAAVGLPFAPPEVLPMLAALDTPVPDDPSGLTG